MRTSGVMDFFLPARQGALVKIHDGIPGIKKPGEVHCSINLLKKPWDF
jgi:hypothetical protein